MIEILDVAIPIAGLVCAVLATLFVFGERRKG